METIKLWDTIVQDVTQISSINKWILLCVWWDPLVRSLVRSFVYWFIILSLYRHPKQYTSSERWTPIVEHTKETCCMSSYLRSHSDTHDIRIYHYNNKTKHTIRMGRTKRECWVKQQTWRVSSQLKRLCRCHWHLRVSNSFRFVSIRIDRFHCSCMI